MSDRQVNIECPHCGHVGNEPWKVSGSFIGGKFWIEYAEGKQVEIEREGLSDCEWCEGEIRYRLGWQVSVEVAAIKWEEQS